MEITLTLFQFISLILFLFLMFYIYRMIEPELFFKITKPFFWQDKIHKKALTPSLKKLEKSYADKVRFYTFFLQIERLKRDNIPGDFAELGVYKGETAELIHAMDSDRKFHLFDTFEGFDAQDLAVETSSGTKYQESNFSDTDLESVKAYVGTDNIHYYPGYFPDSVGDLETEFALVHLDADLYQPTLAALLYFYPRLSPGGVIIVHDYNHTWDGARKAVDEFAATIPESLMEVPDAQGSVMIISNSGSL
jgi:O-methyltransferase